MRKLIFSTSANRTRRHSAVATALAVALLLLSPVPARAANDVIVGFHGAAHETGAHATATTSAAKFLNLRTTRRSVVIKNLDASIIVYVGATSSVAAGNGLEIKPGEWVSIDCTCAQYIISNSGAAEVAYMETYD